jgi:deazaflavin-dependent oxidoreductase (nitroreductase family)
MPNRVTAPKLKPKPNGLDRPGVKRIIKSMSVLHTRMYRLTGGRLGKKWHVGSALFKGVPICLLTTTGAKSGLPRVAPLLYMDDGDRVVLVASQGGLPSNPQWYRNVLANPEVQVQVQRNVRPMRARTATPDERAVLWPRLVELYADFASYQTWTDREIPVVVCEPLSQ